VIRGSAKSAMPIIINMIETSIHSPRNGNTIKLIPIKGKKMKVTSLLPVVDFLFIGNKYKEKILPRADFI
jgi:hypothetical protein